MNTTKENTERYVPTIIQYENNTYMGFITEKESKSVEILPTVYRKFLGTKGSTCGLKEREKPLADDFVYKISLGLYFQATCELKENGKLYNLNKIKHELNDR